ncbi:MAG: DUF1349 domain-containing protein [Sedimentisphaerales bacterium]|nr:DUF1349 domain-containing protein [Sedimentisphaerales bacterium]
MINALTGNRRAIMYDLIRNGKVDEFRKNLKISADVTRLFSEWTLVSSEYCALYLAVRARSSVPGSQEVWVQSLQNADWTTAGEDETINVIYDYSLALPQIDFDHLEYLELILSTNWGGYSPGGIYYLDNVQMLGGGAAYNPTPADGTRELPTQLTLSWIPGVYAAKHDVYFGTNFITVSMANRNNPRGVLARQGQDPNTYTPDALKFGQTYYWRVDEVNDLHPGTKLWTGDIWTFTTAYPGSGVVLGDWEDGMDRWFIWTRTKATSSYSTTGATLNSKSLRLNIPTGWDWVIQLNLNAQQLEDLKANDLFSLDVTWVTSEWQGHSYSMVPAIAINSAATGWAQINNPISDTSNPGSPGNWDPLTFGDMDTRTIVWDYSGINVTGITPAGWTQLIVATGHDPTIGPGIFYFDNARLLNSKLASNPYPADQQKDIQTQPTLTWKPGKFAMTHEVYFGTNSDDVKNANASNLASYPNVTLTNIIDVNSFKPGTLEFNKTYCWRVDGVNEGHPDKLWIGDVWQFTTGNFIVVDDFEDYNDASNIIYDTWADYYVNNTGMTVGHLQPPYAEQHIVHSGHQSMYMHYDNDGVVNEGTALEKTGTLLYSEAQRQWTDPQDWTREGVNSLTLWFRGLPPSYSSFTGGPTTYTMTARGADIVGVSDQFHFAFKQFSGVGDITAKVVSVSNTNAWAKAGVMFRETLDADAKFVMVVVTPGSGVSMQLRSAAGSGSEEVATVATVKAPQWVKLSRSGNTFTGQYSANGTTNWTTIGSIDIPMLTDVSIGLCLTSANVDATCTAEFSNVANPGTGTWQQKPIGILSNSPEQLYVVLQDSAGISNPAVTYPAATTIATYTPWTIPLTSITGVNLKAITKLTIGAGDINNTQRGGSGDLYIDDIRLNRP